MKLKYIVDALNHYYLKKFPDAKGWFIGKEMIEPSRLNAYKKYRVEIFYHLPGKNHLAYTQQFVDRCPEGAEELLKERFFTTLLEQLFTNLPEFDKYETVSISGLQSDNLRGSNDAETLQGPVEKGQVG